MRKLFFLSLLIHFKIMCAQKIITKDYEIVSFEESLKYDLRNMKRYNYSQYNGSTSLVINDNKLFVFPNIERGRSIILSKDKYYEMFKHNSYPVLPENNTAYFLFKNLMNKESFVKDNMINILSDLGLSYNEATFYKDAEKLSKNLSAIDKKKLIVPMLYFIGEDLRKFCPQAKWSFSTRRYFQPFDEPILFYQDRYFTFYYINVLLENKLINEKKMTFRSIYQKVEKNYLKESWFWEKH